ncbi:VCBS domain-containing protein [Pararhizobium sp. YC-54]|uniref:VCBS domain-containing protein n=1 Tax=Pararhizobium sp. YC-54 TaxID=2986920 RepID=UPI0021F7B360|nr:VCBS domain-containing protein [Pararhizobium sp. YC-54]MCW0002366.1 VCBS domain-containing protein [Pararhizobium sp. YC-54]
MAAGETITQVYTVTVTDSSGATSSQTVTVTINGTNDAPVLTVEQSGSVTEDAASPTLSDSGSLSFTDVDVTDTHLVTKAYNGDAAWSGGSLSAGQIAALTGGFAVTGTGWTYDVANAATQFLAAGETITFSYDVTVDDHNGGTDTETVTITIHGTNDAPVIENTALWVPSDPAQQGSGAGSYAHGYPIVVGVPTDVDANDNVVMTANNVPAGIYYFDSATSSYVQLTSGTIVYDPANGTNLLESLVYRPTATINDTSTNTLSFNVSDGHVDVVQTVTIHEVAPTRVPGPTGQIGDGSQPLTSGNDAMVSLALDANFTAAIIANPSAGELTLRTDFQTNSSRPPIDPALGYSPVASGSQNGNNLEAEVKIYITVNGVRFVALAQNNGNPNDWVYDPATKLMTAKLDFDAIVRESDPSESLAEYLTGNPPATGQSWTIQYDDTVGGPNQARYVSVGTSVFDAGDPGIVVTGGTLRDAIYGGSGNDVLNGVGGDDIIEGRGGNDAINGGDGNDALSGGAGNDVIDGGAGVDLLDLSEASSGVTFTLVQSATDTSVNLSAVGLGTDIYRNIEGIIGSDHDDILGGSAFADQIYGGAGSDRMTGGGGGDTFVIADNELVPTIDDVIADYNAAQGDVVDLTALLGELPDGTALENNYVQVVQNGNNAALQVDTDGNGAGWQTVAVLENFSVSDDVVKILFNENGAKTTGEV